MSMRLVLAGFGVAAVLAVGCGGSDDPGTAASTTGAAVSAPADPTEAPTTAAPSTTAAEALPPGAKKDDPAQVVAVFARIAGETDCNVLQKEFDTAAANHDRDSKRDRQDFAKLDTRYMDAADKQMKRSGCY